jgi:subtilase family serine protease
MRKKSVAAGLAVVALAASGLAVFSSASATPVAAPGAQFRAVGARHVCAPRPHFASCLAEAATNVYGQIIQSSKPLAAAFTPQMLEQAYNVKGLKGNGRTVAIVDAYGYPELESDLATFRSTYHLGACTTANGCLTIEGQDGGAPPSGSSTDWDIEQALDVDAVSSICPDCKILMIEAASDLSQGVDTAAATKGVVAISNSYVEGDSGEDPAYHHPGIAITAATGDYGYDPGEYPASDTYVTAVGGTSLYASTDKRGYTESAWSGAGSGCGINKQGAWQKKVHTTCTTKANSDVSAAADPSNGGLNVYDTSGYGGWVQVGGTSEASPIVAAVYALSGGTKGIAVKIPYANTKYLNDVTTGSNGSCGAPLCQAGKGWDGPTGLGTPNGAKGF